MWRDIYPTGPIQSMMSWHFFFAGEAMVLWTIEHCIFAYDSYVKNNESATAVQCEFRCHFKIYRSQVVPTCNTILCWVDAFHTQGTLINRRPVGNAMNSMDPGKCGTCEKRFDKESESLCLETFH